jgi:predicted MFS family arabinose efflux permease
MLLIASTYGMARFGIGLYAPRLVDQRPALSGVLPFAAGAQFVSYSVAAALAAGLVDRRPRAGLVLAGLTASVGCLGVATTSDPVLFVVAVFVAGMGGGFASPALVRVVDAVVSDEASSGAQSLVNAGTAVGVIATGGVAFVAVEVGPAWTVMAGVCAATAFATVHSVRGRVLAAPTAGSLSALPPGTPSGESDRQGLLAVGASAVVAGAGSALLWTFGPSLATRSGVVSPDQVGWLWVSLGIGGLLGPVTAFVTDRLGLRGAWAAFAGLLAAANVVLALALAANRPSMAYAAMSIFGAGYMALSGTLILWAREIRPLTPGAASSGLFIALAIGQAVGAVGFGVVRDHVGATALAMGAAGICALAGAAGRSRRV